MSLITGNSRFLQLDRLSEFVLPRRGHCLAQWGFVKSSQILECVFVTVETLNNQTFTALSLFIFLFNQEFNLSRRLSF